jgi:hypothetical protein
MKRQLRCFGLLLCGLVLVANGCRRGPKPLAIRAAAAARPSALGSVVIANLDRTFDRAEAIAKNLSLPFDKTGQKKTLLDATKVPQALLSALRTDAPVAAVAFAPKAKGKDPELAIAIMGKSPESLRAAMDGLGKPIAARQDAVQFKVGDHGDHGDHGEDDRWFLPRGGSLVVATSLETLIGGAALALELAVAGEDDVTVRLSPAAIATSQGTDLKSALAALRATASESLKQVPGQSPILSTVSESILRSLADRVAEVEEATLSARLDATKGATLRIGATPRKGSTLAAMVGQTKPFALDGRVVPSGDVMALLTFSATDLVRRLWIDLRPGVASDKHGAEAAHQLDTLVDAWTFGGTGSVSVVDNQLRMAGAYALKPGSDGKALLSAIEGLMGGAWYNGLLAATDVKTKIRTRRDKEALVVSTSAEPAKGMPAAMSQALKGMGLTAQTYAMVVGADAFFYASGKDAAATARALMSASPRKPDGPCAQAVSESAEADAFLFMDFAPLVRMGSAAMGAGANPLFSNMNLPLWLSYRGGQSATLELRVPIELARGVAAFAPMLMGALVGGMGQP